MADLPHAVHVYRAGDSACLDASLLHRVQAGGDGVRPHQRVGCGGDAHVVAVLPVECAASASPRRRPGRLLGHLQHPAVLRVRTRPLSSNSTRWYRSGTAR